jgi:pyruvate dehydrogenase E2 component (dihydrolipoamide acetyltransferase)
VVVRDRMKVTMSCDHRVIDGAAGAEFLQTFKKFVEQPLRLLI